MTLQYFYEVFYKDSSFRLDSTKIWPPWTILHQEKL